MLRKLLDNVEKNSAPFLINGSYRDRNFFVTFLLLEPMIILSGNLKSLIASPSLKNSGFEITSNNPFLFFFKSIVRFYLLLSLVLLIWLLLF